MIDDFYNFNFPVLDIDDNLFLREHNPDDTEAFFGYYTDPLVAKHILASNPKTLQEAREELEYCRNLFYTKKGIYWSLVRKDNNEMIGAVGLYINNNHHRAEVSYDLSRNYWRKGIMSKTLRRVLEYAFWFVGVYRIEALTLRENKASMNLLKKCGFAHEGMLRNYRYFQSKAHDVEMFGLTPEMLSKNNNRLSKSGKTTVENLLVKSS